MRFVYQYRTHDNAVRSGEVSAADRDAAYRALKEKGIRPARLEEAPGLANKIFGKGKRWIAIAVLAVVAAVFAFQARKAPSEAAAGNAAPRHQIYGDPATMEAFERGDFESVLPREGDRLLAVFAQPGRLMCRKGFNPRLLAPQSAAELDGYAEKSLSADGDIAIGAGDSREAVELKQIVNGMREEMRAYLANGNGTPRSYWRRLNERTLQEMQIYERTRRELEKESSAAVWEERNAALRRLGLRTIPNPRDAD